MIWEMFILDPKISFALLFSWSKPTWSFESFNKYFKSFSVLFKISFFYVIYFFVFLISWSYLKSNLKFYYIIFASFLSTSISLPFLNSFTVGLRFNYFNLLSIKYGFILFSICDWLMTFLTIFCFYYSRFFFYFTNFYKSNKLIFLSFCFELDSELLLDSLVCIINELS